MLATPLPKPTLRLVRGWKPFQHFQTPPEKVASDQNAERHFRQLDDQLIFAHRKPTSRSPPASSHYNGTALSLILYPMSTRDRGCSQQGLHGKRHHAMWPA